MTHNDIADIYKAYQTNFLTEAKKAKAKDQDLPGAKGKNPKGTMKLDKKGGPKVKGVEKPVEEKNKKTSKKPKKMVKEGINSVMSINNLFDRLYEEVMDDENAALGLDAGEDDFVDMGDEDGGDEVTVSLPRDVAKQLCDALNAMLGEDEDMGEDMGEMEDEDEDMGSPFPEAVEFENAPDGVSKLTGKDNKVGKLPVSSGGGDGKYTDQVGEDGDYGHSLVGSGLKKGHGGKSDHGNMKVKARRPGAPGSHAFGN
jgi:hypothetical protein